MRIPEHHNHYYYYHVYIIFNVFSSCTLLLLALSGRTPLAYGATLPVPTAKHVPSAGHFLLDLPENGTIDACDEKLASNHFIYCSGKLLKAVNYHVIYSDSKTFVDRPMKMDASEVAKAFEAEFPEPIPDIEPDKLRNFVDKYFFHEGEELETCELDEWQEEPPYLKRIKDKTLLNFALHLNSIWKKLCRKIKPEVKEHPDRHSLIYVDKPFIVPGGRFREFYYWDAYWIIKGLIVSGLLETSKSMIQNFAQMVNQYGFVPNGGRVYYLRRSQPPLLTPMVYEYYQINRNDSFLLEILPTLEKEINFWDTFRRVDVTLNNETHTVYQYRAGSNAPRPESYKEDLNVTSTIEGIDTKRRLFNNLASAAESGWDFSSRWMRNATDLSTIRTTKIVPVDLNSYMCWNFRILKHLYGSIRNSEKAEHYDERYRAFLKTFKSVFYLKKESGWYDYDLEKRAHNTEFYLSIASPLFTGCYDDLDLEQSASVFDKMEKMGVFNFVGGVPTSLVSDSIQQWDYPNGWSPLNHMIIEGLRQSRNPRMQQKAYWLAEKWLMQNYRVFITTKYMWEKYNVVQMSAKPGNGGEYTVQEGFGWTNGAVLDLMKTYSDRLDLSSFPENPEITGTIRPEPNPMRDVILRDQVIHESTPKSAENGADAATSSSARFLSLVNLGLILFGIFIA